MLIFYNSFTFKRRQQACVTIATFHTIFLSISFSHYGSVPLSTILELGMQATFFYHIFEANDMQLDKIRTLMDEKLLQQSIWQQKMNLLPVGVSTF